ncbi:MAG TPA: hypothetical protein VGJ66_14165, partial [Pyrinomonadaceae bacterium]
LTNVMLQRSRVLMHFQAGSSEFSQLLGVRRPGAALVGRDLSPPSLNCVILKNVASSVSGQSGARPPHSKELST